MFNKVKEKQFKKNLQLLYHTIDKQSNLLWSHENHITGSRTKRNKNFKETSSWFYKDTTQIGYGEISMGAMIGLFIIFLLEYLDNKLKTPQDIEKHLGISILGIVPSEDIYNK